MKIMTREEAVELELEFVKADASVLGSRVTKAEMRGLAECNVNRYVAFGMLKLEDDPIAMALDTATAETPFVFNYKNHRNEIALRTVTPISIRFGSTEWHKQPQWLLRAFDHEKQAEREFAMAEISATNKGGER